MNRLIPLLALVPSLLAACASYGGRGLVAGESRIDDVERVMGQPAMRWQSSDGAWQLAYPRGPIGFHTYMVHIGPDGRLRSLGNVLDDAGFARVQPGMTKDDVLRVLGPPDPSATIYFKARDELVWDWRYCNAWSQPARFYVHFDATSGKVRGTSTQTESQIGEGGGFSSFCGR